MTIKEMQKMVYNWAVSKGWEPEPTRTFGDECALIHSEVSEALEAYRDAKFNDITDPATGKPEGVGSEFADVFIRLLHYCEVHGFDLEYEFTRKMQYNVTRSYRHGGRNM